MADSRRCRKDSDCDDNECCTMIQWRFKNKCQKFGEVGKWRKNKIDTIFLKL